MFSQRMPKIFVAVDSTEVETPPAMRSAESEWRANRAMALTHTLLNYFGEKIGIKVETSLRYRGYPLVRAIKRQFPNVCVFADTKLSGILSTLRADGRALREVGADVVTVMCQTVTIDALRTLKVELPSACVLGIANLTDHTELLWGDFYKTALINFPFLDGMIVPPSMITKAYQLFPDLRLIAPNIHLEGSPRTDDQNPDVSLTAREALSAGANAVVVGRVVVDADDPVDTVCRILDTLVELTPH